jgi:hypothetical protein
MVNAHSSDRFVHPLPLQAVAKDDPFTEERGESRIRDTVRR